VATWLFNNLVGLRKLVFAIRSIFENRSELAKPELGWVV
jgi:hypothetical protein